MLFIVLYEGLVGNKFLMIKSKAQFPLLSHCGPCDRFAKEVCLIDILQKQNILQLKFPSERCFAKIVKLNFKRK